MCGRYAFAEDELTVADVFGQCISNMPLALRYNIAPSQEAPVLLTSRAGQREGRMLRWGFVPFWAKEPSIGMRMLNARSETVAEKPAYRHAVKKHRCLIPASGFYEWKKLEDGKRKQPYYIHHADGAPIAFAGLRSSWRDKEADEDAPALETFTILTTRPNDLMGSIHDRMPVIVGPDDFDRWLDPAVDDVTALSDLFTPYDAKLMAAHTVSTHVNSPRNDDARCVQMIDPEAPEDGALF
jgi:putative SOS response-associated peptidase YedK